MARPRKYDDDEILKVAAEVFLEQGAGAGTALIAERAGVSEGILFKRFKTKEALFDAALMWDKESDLWREALLDSVGRNTPEENLKRAILALSEKLRRLVPRLMLLEGQGRRKPFPSGAKAPPLEDARAITAYLRGEAKLGRVDLDRPELHAHEIVGAVVHYTMLGLRHQVRVCGVGQFAEHLTAMHLAAPRRKPTRKTVTKRRA